MGHSDRLEQTVNEKQFLIHCTIDDKFVMKIMYTHGVLTAVKDYDRVGWVRVNGHKQKIFVKYTQMLSHHNQTKHLVDDHNKKHVIKLGCQMFATSNGGK